MLSRVKLTNAHTVRGRPTLKNNTECFRNGLVREPKENRRKLSRHSITPKTHGPHRRNDKSEYQECPCKTDQSLNRGMCDKFASRKICVAGYQCDNSDFDFCNAEHMYDAGRRDVALSASFVLECFDGSEVTIRKGNEPVVQKENRVVEEIKDVELRSRRGKFIYNRTYNSVGLNKASHFSRRGRVPSRLPKKTD